MADKRKMKKRKEDSIGAPEPEKPSKDAYAVAKWMRNNVPTKKTKFLSHNVEYFTASKALDALMESSFAITKEGTEPLFPSRDHAVQFLNKMLFLKFFHRARKVPVSEQELKAKLRKKEGVKKRDEAEAESSHTECERKEESKLIPAGDEKEKKKRKIRLEMHMEQMFVDGLDAYVWIYDPIPVYYWFFGSLLVIGAIAICLFPLWPPSVRKGVYYLSVAAAGFLVFIIALAFVRILVFCIVWALTLGRHHLWLLPNLTEDVGFLPSFWPLYQYEYRGKEEKSPGKKKKKDKDSDAEDEGENPAGSEEPPQAPLDEGPPPEGGDAEDQSESESESSQKSQTGKDFEMVEHEEVES
ncbi:hypothetical protein B566_EDAN001653 [Ephemera danica]|nr:hypothetical protein B566_EDAN001653 [Ephemera danica]